MYLARSPHRSKVNVCGTGAKVDTTQQEEIAAQKIGAQQDCKTRPLVEKIQITMDSTRTAIGCYRPTSLLPGLSQNGVAILAD